MDDCEQLEHELDDLNSWYRWELFFCGLKALFSLLGLDWLIDVLRGRRNIGDVFGWLEAFITALLALDIYLVIQWIRNQLPELLEQLPLGEALKQQIKKLLGPVALFFLIVDLGFAIKLFIDCRQMALDTFTSRARRAYDAYDCDRKDQIFRDRGIPVPGP